MTSNIVSTYSTGGGGYRFESLVGAQYLLSLLRGTVTRGIDGITKIVKFQQRFAGNLLDDIVIEVDDGEIEKTLSLQVRRKVTFTNSNSEFKELIHQCWKMFNGEEGTDFNKNTDKLGIVVSHVTQNVKYHLIALLEISRNIHEYSSFFQNIQYGCHSSDTINFLQIFREFLNEFSEKEISDLELWQFLRTLNIIQFDIENEGSSDFTKCWDDCVEIVDGHDQSQAKLLLDQLTSLVTELAKDGGSVDMDSLKQKLTQIRFNEPINFRLDLRNLRRHTNNVLNYIQDTIGNDIRLPRQELVDTLEQRIQTNNIVILQGDPFVGKSTVLKLLANRLRKEGEIIAFSVERLDGIDLDHFLRTLEVKNAFQDILSSIGTSPLRCILIDGLEQLSYQPNKIRIVKEIFSAIQNYNEKILSKNGHIDYCWKIVGTCRNQELDSIVTNVFNDFNFKQENFFEISILADHELDIIKKQNSKLGNILKKKNLSRILKIPGYLDMFARRISVESDFIPDPITESWCYKTFWDQSIRLSEGVKPGKGNANDRENIMKIVGLQSLNKKIPKSTNLDSVALDGLITDELIIKDSNRLKILHDVFEDYSLTSVLFDEKNNIKNFILKNQNSRRLLRPFSLYVSKILEIDKSPEKWNSLLLELQDQNLSPIWRYECLTTPITSEITSENIILLKDHLLQNNGDLLRKLLAALQSIAVKTNPSILKLVKNPQDPTMEKKLSYITTPIQEKWSPIIEFTFDNLDVIDDQCLLEFCNTVYSWIQSNTNNELKKKIIEYCLTIFESRFVNEFEIQSTLGYDEKKKLREVLIKIILISVSVLPDKIDLFLKKYTFRGENHYGFEDILVKDYFWAPMCIFLPKTAVEVFSKICCAKLKPDSFGHFDFWDRGMRGTVHYIPPTYDKGPFIVLLRAHEKYGLELIHKIVNHSTKAWKMSMEIEQKRKPLAQNIQLKSNKIQVHGDENVFRWFRYPSLGEGTVTSALMALEAWIIEKINKQEDIKKLFETVLTGTESVAVVGVCTSIALQFNKISHDAIMPILEQPIFWHMDFRRQAEDLTSEGSIHAMSDNLSFSKKDKIDYEELLKLSKQSHRKNSLNGLIITILVTGKEDTVNYLQNQLKKFPEKNYIIFEDEKKNSELLKERKRNCEIWAASGNLENYKKSKVGDNQFLIEFDIDSQLNEEEKRTKEQFDVVLELQSFMVWSYKLLDENIIGPRFTLESAFLYVDKSLESQFIEELKDFDKENLFDAIASFVAALIINHWSVVQKNNRTKWCRDFLEQIIRRGFPQEYDVSTFPIKANRSIARALPYARIRYPNDKKIKKHIENFSVYSVNEVRNYLFRNLRILYNTEDELIFKCINKLIKTTAKKNFEKYDPKEVHWYSLMSIFNVLYEPPKLKNQKTIKKIFQLLEQLLKFTIKSYKTYQKEGGYNEWSTNSYEWNWSFFRIFGHTILSYPKFRKELLDLVIKNWEKSPAIMEDLLRYLLNVGTIPELQKELIVVWKIFFENIIHSEYIEKFTYEGSGNYRKTILGLLIFMDPEKLITWKLDEWRHLDEMIPFIDKWCDVVGKNIECFSYLISLLDSIGKYLVPQYGFKWISKCVNQMESEKLFSSRSVTTQLSEFLWDSWAKYESEIKQNPENYQIFTDLVDGLIEKDNRLALKLKEKL